MNLMGPFYLGAYWGSRQESSLQCGQRLAECIARLSEIDDALGSWFRQGANRAAAKRSTVQLADVEHATAAWVDWYNHQRLHSSLGYVAPVEYETTHYTTLNRAS